MTFVNDKINIIYYETKEDDNNEKIADETLKFLKNEKISDYDEISVITSNCRIYLLGTPKNIEEIKKKIDPIYFGGKGWYENIYTSVNEFYNKNGLEDSYIIGKNDYFDYSNDVISEKDVNFQKENLIDNIIVKLDDFDRELSEIYDQLSKIKNIIYPKKK